MCVCVCVAVSVRRVGPGELCLLSPSSVALPLGRVLFPVAPFRAFQSTLSATNTLTLSTLMLSLSTDLMGSRHIACELCMKASIFHLDSLFFFSSLFNFITD